MCSPSGRCEILRPGRVSAGPSGPLSLPAWAAVSIQAPASYRLGRPDSEEARLLGKVGRRCHQRPSPLSPLLSLLRVTPQLRSRDRVFPARRFGNSGSEVPCPATPRAGAARVRDSRRCGCLLRPVRATPFVWAGHSHPGTRAPESADGATQVLLTTRRNARTAAVRASPETARSGGKADMWKHG